MKKLFSIFTILCAVVFMASCSSPSTPSDVVKKQIEIFKSGKFEKLADIVYFKGGQTEESAQMFTAVGAKMGPEIEKKGGVDSFEITSEEISEDGATAKVKYSITYGNGNVETETAKTILQDGKWYIDSGK